jgi:tripartite-type tricarboxylate transporter receptor subunit TctC
MKATLFVSWLLVLLSGAPLAAETGMDYSGKTIRIVVGFSAGGGYDVIARMLARHLPSHLQGEPQVIVENMPGAASLKAANYLARVADPDGLTIGMLSGAPVVAQLLGRDGVKFDARTLRIVASPAPYKTVCAFSRSSGVTSFDAWTNARSPIKLGASNLGSSTHDVPIILSYALGLPVKVVPGFKGSAPIRLAVARGDVDGACFAWDSMLATWREQLHAGEIVPVLKTFPEMRDGLDGVPDVQDVPAEASRRALIDQGLMSLLATNRFFALPPDTPSAAVDALRTAVMETFADVDFLADASKARIFIEPLTGDEVAARLDAVLGLDPELAATLKTVLVGER